MWEFAPRPFRPTEKHSQTSGGISTQSKEKNAVFSLEKKEFLDEKEEKKIQISVFRAALPTQDDSSRTMLAALAGEMAPGRRRRGCTRATGYAETQGTCYSETQPGCKAADSLSSALWLIYQTTGGSKPVTFLQILVPPLLP